MRKCIGLSALFFVTVAMAMPPSCNVTVSAGQANSVGDSNFFPKNGPGENSGVSFSVGGLTVGVVSWGGRKTSTFAIANCLNVSSQGMYHMRVSYSGIPDGSPMRSYCYSEPASRLSPKDIVVPMFPGRQWKPC